MSSAFISIVFIAFSPRVIVLEVTFIFIYDTLILTILHHITIQSVLLEQ